MNAIFFITFILCLYDLIPSNGAFDYYDVQPGISEDVVEKDKSGIYGKDDIYSNYYVLELLSNFSDENLFFKPCINANPQERN